MSNTILYSEINRSNFFMTPSTIRWRHRFRGDRESWKINHEIMSIAYDTRKAYEQQLQQIDQLLMDVEDLMDGVIISSITTTRAYIIEDIGDIELAPTAGLAYRNTARYRDSYTYSGVDV